MNTDKHGLGKMMRLVGIMGLMLAAGCLTLDQETKQMQIGGQTTVAGYGLEAKIVVAIKSPEKPEPTPTPTPDPAPVVEGDTDLSGYTVLGGFDFRNAKTTVKALSVSCGPVGADTGPFAILLLEKPVNWSSRDGACNGTMCVAWAKKAGYFDYIKVGETTQRARLQHIIDGYGGPASGEDVGFFVMNEERTERSNVVWTKWP